jgi:hypothetical protein
MKRYLLDTNIVSLLAHPQPDPRVLAWIREQSPLSLSISVLVIGEIEKGIGRLPPGLLRNNSNRGRKTTCRPTSVGASCPSIWPRRASGAGSTPTVAAWDARCLSSPASCWPRPLGTG